MTEASSTPHNILIPLDETGCLDDANYVRYLFVQVAPDIRGTRGLSDLVRSIPYVMMEDEDDGINFDETMIRVRHDLVVAGYEIIVIAIATGLTWMKI